MKMRSLFLVLAVVLVLGLAVQVSAAVLWSDGFEGYKTDSGQIWGGLDKNKGGSPNAANNGTGNPWFGPSPNNGWVTKATTNPDPIQETVTPHSGQFMMRGGRNGNGWYNGYDGDLDHVNLAFRANGGHALTSNVSLDWWFYDILGNSHPGDPDLGPGNFGDFVSLESAASLPTNTDYSNGGDQGAVSASLAIGAYEGDAGYDTSVYQVQCTGSGDFQFGTGWFNTSIDRTKGWHHAVISIGTNNTANFYIDDQLAVSTNYSAPNGFNLLTTHECWNTPDNYNQSAYYDDFRLQTIPEPASILALATGLLALAGLRRRRS